MARQTDDPKHIRLAGDRIDPSDRHLTTQQGVRIDDTDNSLSVGDRGPTLLEDFHTREKLTHFDHERIPERVVHARGAGAYGTFRAYDDRLAGYTCARFLTDPDVETPVFVRFSTVAGSRGSADTVRDVRGFATKFYTEQGNYDLVGNNFPVFFIQDGIKFPDLVHAVKPEPDNEIPQAQSAHDTFWDFVSLQPETLHTVMWLMSDRALPRSYRMMQGFGVHTFRLVDAQGRGTFVKFHWRPKLGTHSLIWEECQKVAGADPDFNRRDLWDAIAGGDYPEWELGVQLVDEADESAFDFDLLDATKIIPEEQVPVRPVGRMVLNRNPDNFFAETEQVAFHTANVVPGIDFTNDPLLQARNFSYLDTQLIRLGGPNFSQLPVNRPVADVVSNQRDGYGQQRIHVGRTSYSDNSIGGGCPAMADEDTYRHYAERVEGHKIRRRSESFADHYSQCSLFWNSMTEPEADHIVAAFRFELGKVREELVRVRVVDHLGRIDPTLAERVAAGLGLPAPKSDGPATEERSPALSQIRGEACPVQTRKVAVLAADGVDAETVRGVITLLHDRGVVTEILGPHEGELEATDGAALDVDRAIDTMASVLYDAVLVAGGAGSTETLQSDGYATHFVAEAYRHLKPIAALGEGTELLAHAGLPAVDTATVTKVTGVVTAPDSASVDPAPIAEELLELLSHHRVWDRDASSVPA
ncbi:catalase [Rhodococcus sp. D2-41]|uniref:catalase n=1 Tax=Speluncibacter jeojiensis TaxID=2710754 RepID=UPI00240FA7E5|nr:catalase [Rhodococcus sp. D2-41]MDG3010766.1 catalase [Rhodococcus sp. D2-41]